MAELGLYIHIPFCRARCAYCDFNTYTGLEHLGAEYVDRLLRELELRVEGDRRLVAAGAAGPCLGDRTVTSIFVGGGTPTALSGEQLARLLGGVRERIPVAPGAEVTCEANPGTIAPAKLAAMRAAGFNRLSCGAQSFQPRLLRRMGRIHGPAEIAAAVGDARASGFDNVNLDLIFGLPGQTLAMWADDLERAVALEPDHLSCYSLIVEEGTPFHAQWINGLLDLPDEDEWEAMFDLTRQRLARAGFDAYEISNFARPGRRCRHNLLYWRNGEYLGLGAGAVSYWRGRRATNEREPLRYLAAVDAGHVPEVEVDAPDGRAAMAETAFLALRTADGIRDGEFLARHGMSLRDAFGEPIRRFVAAGLLEWERDVLRLTGRGVKLGNQVFAEFV